MAHPPSSSEDPFPWHIPLYDAHCHPTDIMSSIPALPTMRTRCLTIMSTRSQDQSLVAQVADQYGVSSPQHDAWTREECMVPCFGWHPWFAHELYVDSHSPESQPPTPNQDANGNEIIREDPKVLTGAAKIAHYQSILLPRRDTLSEEDTSLFHALPSPTPLSAFLASTKKRLQDHPLALIGEIGLDRSFRIPYPPGPTSPSPPDGDEITPGRRAGRKLTPYRVSPAHQRAVFKAQLQLAAEMGRAVSVHGVQAHGLVYECVRELWTGWEREVVSKRERRRREREEQVSLLSGSAEDGGGEQEEKEETDRKGKGESPPYPPRLCLHSYSGTPTSLTPFLHPRIPLSLFLSFSTAINLSDALTSPTPAAFAEMVRAVPDDMLLVESDLHTAGPEMDRRMEDVVRRVCAVKGWGLEDGVRRLGANWRRFVLGTEDQ